MVQTPSTGPAPFWQFFAGLGGIAAIEKATADLKVTLLSSIRAFSKAISVDLAFWEYLGNLGDHSFAVSLHKPTTCQDICRLFLIIGVILFSDELKAT